MNQCRIGIVGCGGRMGRMLIAEIAQTEGAVVAGGTEQTATLAGQDLGTLAGLGPLGVAAGTDAAALIAASDAIIDFTVPAATVRHAELAAAAGKILVIGTTGLDAAQTRAIEAAARQAPIVWSANMSLGVNLLLGLVEQVAARLGPDYDIEIQEMHHRMKIDAPSGTALALGRAAAAGRGVPLEDVWVKSRDGHTGARAGGSIGFATLRGGDVVGDHTVMFAGLGERLELTHKAADRRIYARGAVRAALWAVGRPPGLYGMKDVLGLR
ncbi:MAG TPA: 4-hydroxy-tetrahydrodipicolinate reductase [Aliidongia sp.]|uniref:4-hydroxy-tetrahydrodipicolinate reductase n=1 Tax=Aliidongia sp. TaxID=1914230 RepID=UPI002DDCA6EB|nr:4-hydroxy-tetrahydrodipicolinate reductase [Aliidongia sp.]HEV2678251.1 4-hydroxy-tetrahydrodipicolinate reductase [Aliidongia sp.]